MNLRTPLLILALVTGAACAHPAEDAASHTIAVVGTGVVEAAPDRVRINAQASALARDPAAARATVDRQIASAREALSRAGVGEDSLRAQSIRIQAEFDYRNQERILRGYRATRDFSVILDDLDRAGPVLDALLAAGLPELSGLSYEVAEPSVHHDAARDLAVADARRKAEQVAEGLGARVGTVRRVQLGSSPIQPGPMPTMMMAREADASYAPDDLSFMESVSVEFDLIVD